MVNVNPGAGVSGSGLTVTDVLMPGTTQISGGTNGYILYNDNGVLGEKATTGSGSVVLATAPTITNAALVGATSIVTVSNAEGLRITGYSLTSPNNQSLLTMAGTLNTSGIVNVVQLAISNVGAGAGSTFVNLFGGAAGSTSVYRVDLTGGVQMTGTLTTTTGNLTIASAGGSTTATGNFFMAGTTQTGGTTGTTSGFKGNAFGVTLRSDTGVFWNSTADTNGSADTALTRAGAGILGVPILQGVEVSAPAAPAANGYRLFAQDNGAGKTQLMVLFATGAAQQVAIEP